MFVTVITKIRPSYFNVDITNIGAHVISKNDLFTKVFSPLASNFIVRYFLVVLVVAV